MTNFRFRLRNVAAIAACLAKKTLDFKKVLIGLAIGCILLFISCNRSNSNNPKQNVIDVEKNEQALLILKREHAISRVQLSLMNDLKNESGFTDDLTDGVQSQQFVILLVREFKTFGLLGLSMNDRKMWIPTFQSLTYNGKKVFKAQYYDDGNKIGVYLAFSENEVLQEGDIIPENGVLLVENHLYDYTPENLIINILDKN